MKAASHFLLDYCQVIVGNSIMQTNECLALLRLDPPVVYFLLFFYNVSPLPCSHPACSKFCVHLQFLPEIVCKVGKVYKVGKVRSTFHTFHDYLNFYGEKKMTGYRPFTFLLDFEQ